MLGVGAAEVEPLRQLLLGLVERVVDLLPVDLADDVERRVRPWQIAPVRVSVSGRRLRVRCRAYPFALPASVAPRHSGGTPGGLPERPMGADCKSVAKATEVRILYPPHKPLTSTNGWGLDRSGPSDLCSSTFASMNFRLP